MLRQLDARLGDAVSRLESAGASLFTARDALDQLHADLVSQFGEVGDNVELRSLMEGLHQSMGDLTMLCLAHTLRATLRSFKRFSSAPKRRTRNVVSPSDCPGNARRHWSQVRVCRSSIQEVKLDEQSRMLETLLRGVHSVPTV